MGVAEYGLIVDHHYFFYEFSLVKGSYLNQYEAVTLKENTRDSSAATDNALIYVESSKVCDFHPIVASLIFAIKFFYSLRNSGENVWKVWQIFFVFSKTMFEEIENKNYFFFAGDKV